MVEEVFEESREELGAILSDAVGDLVEYRLVPTIGIVFGLQHVRHDGTDKAGLDDALA